MREGLLPTNLSEWEAALTRHFLMISGHDVGPIRSFDICADTLALAAGAGSDAGDDAVTSFRKALTTHKSALFEALEQGYFLRHSNADCLGCFAYLALTVYVDSQLDSDDEGGTEFRSKLADFLGVDRSFSDLHGVRVMWERLRDWLTQQTKKTKPFRRLILPEENGWTHIGYSVRLSFPSRRDKTFLANFFADHASILDNEDKMLTRLRNLIEGSRASPGLKVAFGEFYAAYSSRQRSLADHRFWVFVQTVARLNNVRLPMEMSLHLVFDEDGVPVYFVQTQDESEHREMFHELERAVRHAQSMGRSNLSRGLDAGFLVFSRIGHTRWSASSSFDDCRGSVHLGLGRNAAAIAGSKLGKLKPNGEWSLTAQPVLVGKAEEALTKLLPKNRGLATVNKPTISDGVRVDHHWLGRPGVLPTITTDAGPIRLVPAGAGDEPLCEDIEARPNVYAIKAASPLDGLYTLQGESSAPTSLRFVRNSPVHADRKPLTGIPIKEWTSRSYLSGRSTQAPQTWQDVPQGMDDLLEAIYAGGRSGWNEFELIRLLERVLPRQLSSWDLLRSLHDSSFLAPFLRAQFRGRIWTLGETTLVPLRAATQDAVIVDGCVGALLMEDFRSNVLSMGGIPFRLLQSEWSVPLLGATGVDVSALAARLRWKQSRALMPSDRIGALAETERRLEPYDAASHWSWDLGRFSFREDRSPVRLTRWVHRSGRDHDVYEVIAGARSRRFLSRASAIMCAHMSAKRPLFKANGHDLVRTAKDGFLPEAMARWLRYANFANPSVSSEGGYSYPAQAVHSARIAAILPDGVDAGASLRPVEDIVSSVRRSGWSTRMVWTGSGLSAGRVPFGPDKGSYA